MKKLLVLVFGFSFGSCSKQINFDFILTHNTNIVRVWSSGNFRACGWYEIWDMAYSTHSSRYKLVHLSSKFSKEVKTGENIYLTMGVICDSIVPIHFKIPYNVILKLLSIFVDDVLEEERAFSETVNGQTIDFTVP